MPIQGSVPLSSHAGEATWYALYTRHQHEKAVANMLSNKGFEVFLPLYAAVHRWKDRNKQLLLPLFPCYVLLKGGLDRRLDVVTTPGVFALVGAGGRPAMIPPEEIEAIRRATESSLRIEPHPFLKCGDRVRVKSGPLKGIEGILVRKKNLYRLVLSVELLGKSAAVEIDVFLVERAPTPIPAAASHSLLRNTFPPRSLQPLPSGHRILLDQ
jgi:transcription antitermination factor NusG